MELMVSSFTLALAACISIIIAEALHHISVNYISMLIGIVIALVPLLNKQVASFSSEIFMELIVAPLLFFEGQTTRFNNVTRNLKKIIGITVIMVVIALIAAGFSAAWIGKIGLPLAFIISAISTPTDATATEAVTAGLKVPHKVNASLKSESLFNDASGIILLNMAILWFINGYINYGQTITNFLYSSIGGAIFGSILGWLFITFRQFLLRTSFNSLNAQNLIYILTPLIIYVLSEELHLSGIIAVVVAGLLHNAEAEQSLLINSRQVHMGFDLQNLISEIFNSTVFVVLGILMVRIFRTRIGNDHIWQWIGVGVTIYIANLVVRYLYSLLALKFGQKNAVIFALGGIHGAVTLSLALTLSSRLLGTGNYNLVIMAEATLILLSMLVPTFIFQFILPHQVNDKDAQKVVYEIRRNMVKRAIQIVHRMYLPERSKKYIIYMLLTQKKAVSLRESLKAVIKSIQQEEFTPEEKALQRMAFYRVFAIEREYLEMIGQQQSEYREYLLQIYNDILLAESLIIDPEQNGED